MSQDGPNMAQDGPRCLSRAVLGFHLWLSRAILGLTFALPLLCLRFAFVLPLLYLPFSFPFEWVCVVYFSLLCFKSILQRSAMLAILAQLAPSWGYLGILFGQSWGYLVLFGAILSHLGTILNPNPKINNSFAFLMVFILQRPSLK